ncbi:hypothetical protein PVA45_07800 (plasmid) [Entomospira entomophila]|uniref:Uncharacterized protein n=1 Tax=Entomospira entomophila TaxID=2719988 RepID=A0A968GBC3_9SPIO|nr:hypothetical protein [Entomospira entomophilus]NIZ41407.1 hypothetical protein [Entomospira entomophilus]WDI36357.1 hypothetical protein PVA45_07800 [Entomospira entomophilus]
MSYQEATINSVIQRDSHTRNSLTLEIDGLSMTLEFRKGGSLESPVRYQAMSHGGIGAEGLYDEWICQGEVSVSQSLYEHLHQLYQRGASLSERGATHTTFAAIDGGVRSRHLFKHVLLRQPPKVMVEQFADTKTLLHVVFSLNDLISME